MKDKFINILICPKCHGELQYNKTKTELVCKTDAVSFQIRNGIPIMLFDQAKQI